MTTNIKKDNLLNVVEMNIKNPSTFLIPSNEYINMNLTIGSIIKICNNFERFFVVVEDIENDNYVGKIVNHLLINRGYNYGDLISFTKNNILAIYSKDHVDELNKTYGDKFNTILLKGINTKLIDIDVNEY